MKRQLFILFMALFAVNLTAQNILTSPFTLGFLGDASGNNSATNCVYIQNVGVSKVQFIQDSPQQIYVSQGNDIPGEVKLTDATGVDYLIPGFIKWRAPSGNNPSTMIFKPNTGVNLDVVIYNNGQNQVYNISPAKYIGLTFSGSTLNIVNGQVSGNSASMLTILNNYVSSLAKLTVSDVTVAEEDGSASVTILRSGSLNETVSVDYLFSNGTAINGSDFTGISGTANLAIGVTSSVISVPIIDNSVFELTETFTISLNNPQNSSLNGGTAVITILDSDSMVFGCMDTTACNFNPCVFQDNGSCIYPTDELCNGIDDDCDAVIDNGFPLNTFYVDQDADGYGDSNLTILACQEGPGMSAVGGDCDDSNFNLNPGVTEICNNVDDDCDGTIDNGFDLDSDSWTTCEGDCNDADPSINPGVLEGPFQDGSCDFIDNNCDGVVDEYWDQDQDTYTVCEGDCDDFNDQIHPGVVELCNNIDDNCNTEIDENLEQYPVYTDADGDGYGVDTGTTSCTPSTITPGDCDDNNAAINPAAVELCNNIDDNCNSQIDENLTQYPVYTDADGDGYGVDTGTTSCTPSTITPGDCDDSNNAINPNAAEVCGDDIDENCDGQVNEGCVPGCTDDTACNFDEAATYDDGSCTYATAEICNNIDDDCDGVIDNGVLNTYYVDADGDGYGDINDGGIEACTAPQGTVDNNTDCDDSNNAINPAAVELCNNIDDNCNDEIDENLEQYPVYTDADGDGYGVDTGTTSCTPSTITPGDCDDNNAAINPNAAEVCGDDVDENCDGQVNEGCVPGCTDATACNFDEAATYDDGSCTYATSEICNNIDDDCDGVIDNGVLNTYYVDADGDGYGDINDGGIEACTAPQGTVDNNTDCDDSNNAINPSAVELCNNIDDNCNNQVDESLISGCTDFTAFNYNPDANCDNGQCIPRIYGCTNADACNYVPSANTDDSTCVVFTIESDTNNVCGNQPVVLNAIVTGLAPNSGITVNNGPISGFIGPFFFENSSYYISSQSTNWASANEAAIAMGGQLAVINSNDELNYVKNLIGQNGVAPWIGLTQDVNAQDFSEPAGGWYWTNGVPFAFNWDLQYDTEPNNCTACCGSVENAGQLYNNGTFNDLCINTNTQYLVEFNQSASYNIVWSNGMQGNQIVVTNYGVTNYLATLTWPGGQCSRNITISTETPNSYYTDADGDGYGDINALAVEACTAPQGTVDNNTDCDDSNALVNPAQTEVCNDVDDNCNGQIDEGLTFVDYYTDSDLDGYGTTPVLNYCLNPGLGYTTTSGDCDDFNPAINPGEVEVCNNIDDNCNSQIDENLEQYPVYTDADGDGYGVDTGTTSCTPSTITPGDCDDNNAAINPNAAEVCGDDVDENCDGQVNEGCVPGCTDATACNFDEAATYDDGSCTYATSEICNNIDDDCDGVIDNGVLNTYYVDADGDGYGDINDGGIEACTAPQGTVDNNTDCDDSNALVNPAQTEVCNDVDDNCDNIIDEGVKTMYYTDADGDGYGDINDGGIEACTAPQGTVDNNTDCDDSNALVNPAQTEVCNDVDDNCNGQIDEGLTFVDYFTDSDLDGYGTTPVLNYCLNPGLGYTTTSGDCDDLNPAINPGEVEVCNNIDDNCNDEIDENLTQYPVYTDADGDGYGVDTGTTSCTPSTITPGDCDDNNAAINPNVAEVCGDDVDENCDGQVNEGCVPGCTDDTACNFDEAATYDDGSCTYATAEICNNIDDDCDGVIDNGVLNTYYVDADGDGYGDINDGGIEACTAPQGTVDNNTDCDDSNALVNPAQTEVCNDVDDNCDNIIDEGVKTMYYTDADGDGYGDINALAVEACTAPQGTVDNNTDCDDSNALVNPAQTEVCNDVDDNCNGQIDEGLIFVDYFTDSDLDGYGTTPVLNYCLNPGLGYTTTSGDCDDLNPAINPGEVEVCNNIDDNCNSQIDENLEQYPVYTDADGDGYGVDTGTTSCTPSTITPGDCDDNNAAINPNAAEVCGDDVDENCDGQVNEGCVPGCTDATACNFDEAATYDDGSCTYATAEICNNIDDDCDGVIDNGVLNTYYVDADGDGYGDINDGGIEACTAPQGTVDNNTDCDDSNALVNPAQTEVCNDVDDNCNGQIDEGLTFVDYYTDSDLDGYGTTPVLNYCLNPGLGYTTTSGDCDDLNPAINPGEVEVCNNIDDNCNSQIDENLEQYPVYTDADGDGYGVDTGTTSCTPSTITPGDCDDSNALVNPAQTEVCNDVDDNCDNIIDEGVKTMYYTDADGDGYGDINDGGIEACTAPQGTVDNNTDCDDSNALVNPAQTEVCNDVDDNCNGQIDEGLTFVDYYTDSDLDGYGTTPVLNYCLNPGLGYTTTSGDCDDLNPAINPGEVEVCNNIDDNCNDEIDENLEQYPVYTDADGDGYGVDTGTTSCTPSTITPGDCDDNNAAINPNAAEVCGDDIDENCDGQVNEGCVPGCTDDTACNFDEAATYDDGSCTYATAEICNNIDDDCDGVIDNGVLNTYYVDADGDGYGDINDGGIEACTAPQGTVDNNTDCDDSNALVNPAQTEVCNDVDDNCNDEIDENLTQYPVYTDADGDGYGVDTGTTSCTPSTITPGDCDDSNALVNPAQTEVCNDVDDNCDNIIDEGVKTMYYTDADGDGYGDINDGGIEACTAPQGTVDNNTDCDDSNALVNPAQTEVCNDVDDNCNGQIDEGLTFVDYFTDSDLDGYGTTPVLNYCLNPGLGYTTTSGDCDDLNPAINPGEVEVCNNIDDNCNTEIDENLEQYPVYTDADGDGYGVDTGTTSCTPSTITPGDCDDNNAAINPNAAEVCGDDVDENCDGQVNEGCVPGCTDDTACNFDEAATYDDGSCTYATAEICNNIDDDCDGVIDNGVLNTYYVDADGDGYGDINDGGIEACTAPQGTVDNNTDCDDSNNAINPSAVELCNNIDDNCNSQIDENLEQYPVYTDADGDGYGVDTGTTSCTPSTITPGDCDDNNAAINPNAAEVCGDDVDENCDGQVNEGCVPGCTDDTACNFDEAATYDDGSCTYATAEICNNIDDDCDGVIDNGVLNTYYVDADGDGYGDINDGGIEACTAPQGTVDNNTDCDDSNNAINPAAVELCNNIDDNCNSQIDENLTQYPVYTDADGDGYGVDTGTTSCTPSTITPGDCDDSNNAINPNAAEVCGDDIDENCDGQVNEGCVPGCTDDTACNFDEAATYDDGSCTYATAEICNNIDDDCDGVIDNGVLNTYYVDADGDGYGDINDGGIEACTAPQGTVDNNTDCDDSNNAINPAAVELCNNIDDNCNDEIDENLEQYPVYTDADGDGYGVDTGTTSCTPSTITPGDCDDNNAAINPNAAEVCGDDVDENCDGQVNEGCVPGCTDATACNFDEAATYDDGSCTYATSEICNNIDDDCDGVIDNGVLNTYYVDADGDGYGDINDGGIEACTAPQGTVDNNTDCDDSNNAINPSATEVCNDVDDNCNTEIDENLEQYPVYTDADGDGYGVDTGTTSCTPSTITPGDCDDNNPAINPNAAEVCGDDVDENCDGQVNEGCVPGCTDATACNFDEAATEDDGSCIYPQPEICNAIDDDCDGIVNNGLSMEALNTVTVNTAYFPACTPTNIFSANPFTGTNTATIDGEGKDRWYKWNAQYNSLRIGLSAAIGDYSIHLFREYPGCLALEMIEHEVTSGNQTLITDELTVGANYYFAVHEHAGPGNTSAKLCINHFLPSDCDHFYSNGTGEYASVCGSFKTLYRGNANNYMINVLSASQAGQNLGIQPWVYQAGSSSVIARLGSILPSNLSSTPVVYTVNVPVMYSIPDAAENYTPVFAQATSTCTITLLPQTPIQVRASDRCPNIKAINSYIAPDQTICGSTAYQWEFTDCTNGVSNATTQVLTGANGSSIFMLNNIPGIAPGKFYQVRVRPVHGSGVVSAWGTVQCVMIQGSGMVVQEDNTSAIKVSSDMGNVLVYPNPTTTGDVNIAFEKPMEGQLNLEVTNLLGQQVYQETLDFSGVTHKLNLNKIAKGMFQMTIRINGMEQTTRIVRD